MKNIAIALIILFISFNSYAQLHIDTASFFKNNAGVYSIVITKNDQVVYQKYYNGHIESSLFNDQSLTKSICSILIGIAIDKGYIKSVDEKVVDFFPELKTDP